MSMSESALKAAMKSRIYNALKKEFSAVTATGVGYTPEADAQWQKIAAAIAESALDIIAEVRKATVIPPTGPLT